MKVGGTTLRGGTWTPYARGLAAAAEAAAVEADVLEMTESGRTAGAADHVAPPTCSCALGASAASTPASARDIHLYFRVGMLVG